MQRLRWLNLPQSSGIRATNIFRDLLADIQYPRRHRRNQRHPRPSGNPVQLRHSTASTEQGLKDRVQAVLNKHDLEYELKWSYSKPI